MSLVWEYGDPYRIELILRGARARSKTDNVRTYISRLRVAIYSVMIHLELRVGVMRFGLGF